MFLCHHCVKKFHQCHVYINHVKVIHSHEPFFKYICGFKGCPVTFKSYQQFRKHLLQHEELNPSVNNLKMVCSCGYKSYLKSKFMYHFKQHKIICPIKNCESVYNVYSSFSSHISNSHPCYKVQDINGCVESPNSCSSLNNSYLHEISSDTLNVMDEVLEKPKFTDSISLFVLQMQEKFLLPESVISEIISGMNQLHKENIESFKEKNSCFFKR